ncbi:MAG: hypothetical protein KAJ07_08010 [Planctomycetes bacterium]|nr:hypothetical protein [Planctomycetota bacterium]
MENSDIRKMLEVAVVAARLAGQRAVEEIKYAKSSIKNGREIVTNADPICQEIIINTIKDIYPDHGFIAEEGADGKMLRQLPRSAEPIWWIIDPIDGTNNFAHGMLCFTVSIAAVYQGTPIVAVIFDPSTESMYTAAKEMDAQLNTSRINVSGEDVGEFSSFGIDSHFTDDKLPAYIKIMQTTRFRNLGTTALHLAYIAKGSMTGAVTSVAKLWDIAAGAFIIETAGGIVTDMQGNNIFPVDVEAYNEDNYCILAANKKTHSEVLKLFTTL